MRFLLSRWTYSLLGVIALAGIVWFFGPLLGPLEPDWARAAVILVMLLAWGGGNWLIGARARARDDALSQGVVSGDAEGEMAAVEDKISTALALLKKARGTRGALTEQPWYVIIGPPGSGKTTALLNAGLEFPLAEQMGKGAVAGVGGTRLCEWWFTEHAVMIDTAGRYTTQDSDADVDRAGWDKFLDMLKRTRPKQPLNGVIVAIALSDIAQATRRERETHAKAIRARVGELEARLGLRLPVYALFTKVDLLAGFMEFFEDLDRDGRAQVWGVTFPHAGKEEPAARFQEEFRALLERVHRRMLDRLKSEANPERRAAIAGFPTQVASLEAPLGEFVQAAFGPGEGTVPQLRGVYLNSATQEGTPIDRLTGAIARAFGLSPQRQARLRPQEGRTFFLTSLLRDVVFNEAMLVAGGTKKDRGALWLGIAAAVALLAILGTGGFLWRAHVAGQRAIEAGAAALASYEQAATGLKLDPVDDADLPALLPLLDRAAAAIPPGAPDEGGLLSQDGKIAAGLRGVYRHALERALFPRLIWRLEAQLRGNLANPELLYEATRVYLMLTSDGPIDRDLLREWMTQDWQQTWPGLDNGPLRKALAVHLDALLAEPLPAIVADGALVTAARETFDKVTLAQRVYGRVRPSQTAQALPVWKPGEALGAAGSVIFMRGSGKSLDEGVPGFYSGEGFEKVLLPALSAAARQTASEGWVIGRKIELDPQGPGMRALEQEVIGLYLADFQRQWDGMIADLTLVPLRSLTQAAQDLYILASEHSPMRALVASMAKQLALPGAAAAAVDARYKPLRDMAGTALDRQLRTLGDLQQQLARLAAAGFRTGPQPTIGADDPAVILRTEAQRLPQPVARWLDMASASGLALRGGDPKLQVVAAYNAPEGPAAACQAVTAGKFPFVAGAREEASVEQFARLFAPGGILDGYFNILLRPYIDMRTTPWKALVPEGGTAPVTAADVAQFQRAAQIRDMFFADGRTVPHVRLDVAPVSIDARAQRVTLDLAGAVVTFAKGEPPRAVEVSWPGGTAPARLAFEPPASGPAWTEQGPWAVLRLIARGRAQGAPEKQALAFQAGERQAVFEFRSAAKSPLALSVLQAFRCPSVQ